MITLLPLVLVVLGFSNVALAQASSNEFSATMTTNSGCVVTVWDYSTIYSTFGCEYATTSSVFWFCGSTTTANYTSTSTIYTSSTFTVALTNMDSSSTTSAIAFQSSGTSTSSMTTAGSTVSSPNLPSARVTSTTSSSAASSSAASSSAASSSATSSSTSGSGSPSPGSSSSTSPSESNAPASKTTTLETSYLGTSTTNAATATTSVTSITSTLASGTASANTAAPSSASTSGNVSPVSPSSAATTNASSGGSMPSQSSSLASGLSSSTSAPSYDASSSTVNQFGPSSSSVPSESASSTSSSRPSSESSLSFEPPSKTLASGTTSSFFSGIGGISSSSLETSGAASGSSSISASMSTIPTLGVSGAASTLAQTSESSSLLPGGASSGSSLGTSGTSASGTTSSMPSGAASTSPTSTLSYSNQISSSTASSIPTSVPNTSMFFSFTRNSAVLFLVLDPDGTISATSNCTNATVVFDLANGTLTANGLYAQANDITAGTATLTFGPYNPSAYQTTFGVSDGVLAWTNPAFANAGNEVVFVFPASGQGLVEAVFQGSSPNGYTPILLNVGDAGISSACVSQVISTSSAASSSGSGAAISGLSSTAVPTVLPSSSETETPSGYSSSAAASTAGPSSSTGTSGSSAASGTISRCSSFLPGHDTSSTTRNGLSRSVPPSTFPMTSQVSTTQISSFPMFVSNDKLSSAEIAPASVTSPSASGLRLVISTVYTRMSYTITSCRSTETECSASIGLVTTDIISLYTTICPETVPTCSASSTEPSLETTSTIYTTVTYTITSCHPTITNCPIGHITTDTISVYTTVCPAKTHAASTQPAYVIGVLVTIIVDVTVEVVINEISGLTETFFITETILCETAPLWNSATEGQACYTCSLTSQGYPCLHSGVTATRTLLLSSLPFNAPAPNTPLMIQTCSTCSLITLTSETPFTTPPATQTSNAFVPAQHNPELALSVSPLGSNELQLSSIPMIDNEFPSAIPSFKSPETTQPPLSQPLSGSGHHSISGVALPSSTGPIASPTHHAGVGILGCNLDVLILSILTSALVLLNI